MTIVSRIIGWVGLALFGVMLLTSIAFFSQKGDISHTVLSSYAYLQGHVLNFYDYNLNVVGGNSYLPTVYIIFAIWMFPLYALGLTSSVDLSKGVIPQPLEMNLYPLEIFWAKTLLIIAFLISVYIFREIAKRAFGADTERVWLTTVSFLTAPLAFFAVGIFNQYDVFSVLFTLLGLLFLVDGKRVWFGLFLGLAISLKFFAVLLVLPLVLFFIPKWFDRLRTSLIIVAVPLTLSMPYLTSDAFRGGVFSLVSDRATNPSFSASLSFTLVLYAGVVFWTWKKGPINSDPFKALSVIGVGVYAVLFNSVFFHPQWLIIITPFLALAVGYVKSVTVFLWLETLGFLAFTWYTVNMWPANVDSVMILNGPLSSGLLGQPFPLSVFYSLDQASIFLIIFKVILLVLAISPIAFAGNGRINKNSINFAVALVSRALAPLYLIIFPSIVSLVIFA